MNNSLKHLLRFILLAIVPSISHAQTEHAFYFVQLADPQFGMYTLQKDFHKERRNLTLAIDAINRLKPDFVVICGDIVNSAGDERQIAAYKETMSTLDRSLSVYLVAGNHDVGNVPTSATLEKYRDLFGPDYYSFKRNGQRFIVLNSSLLKDPSKAKDEADAQLKWLKAVLDTAREEHGRSIVFQHHPWFVKKPREPNGYFNIPVGTRTRYLKLLEGAGVSYVFAGHLHANASGSYKSLRMITSGPVGMPLGSSPSGMRIVFVAPSGIKHKYYSLKNIPQRMNLESAADAVRLP